MSTIIIITRPPVPNNPGDEGEDSGPLDIENAAQRAEAHKYIDKLAGVAE